MAERIKGILSAVLTAAVSLISVLLAVSILITPALSRGELRSRTDTTFVDVGIMDRYEMRLNNSLSDALQGVLSISKVWWLNDDDMVAPKPRQECYGSATDAASLGWLLEAAAPVLEGQSTQFHTGIQIAKGTKIHYYLDETIFAISWKEMRDNGYYTYSEVKIMHPSQLRRFLAGGEFGSQIQLKTTEMATIVNAVLASAGDFYGFRRHGVIVYDGIVQRVNTRLVDTVYVDDQGDLLISYIGELSTVEEAQKFVDDNNIRFSMAFGPAVLDHGKLRDKAVLDTYYLGEVGGKYPRTAFCQKDRLHYMVVVVNGEGGCENTATLSMFVRRLQELDVHTVYILDGGQTSTVAMNNELLNDVLMGSQRNISDIFYFATALPEGE